MKTFKEFKSKCTGLVDLGNTGNYEGTVIFDATQDTIKEIDFVLFDTPDTKSCISDHPIFTSAGFTSNRILGEDHLRHAYDELVRTGLISHFTDVVVFIMHTEDDTVSVYNSEVTHVFNDDEESFKITTGLRQCFTED